MLNSVFVSLMVLSGDVAGVSEEFGITGEPCLMVLAPTQDLALAYMVVLLRKP